jgi:hypothetical protein
MNYVYGNTLTIKSSSSEFEFHGKPNAPNVTFGDGKQYISTKLYIHKPSITGSDGEMCIEHMPSTNYEESLLLYFPLKTDQTTTPNCIDRMILAKPGESLEVNLNAILPMNGDFNYKGKNIAVFTTPVVIQTKIFKDGEPILEGGCSGDDCSSQCQSLTDQLKEMNNRLLSVEGGGGGGGGANGSGGNTGVVSETYLNNLLKTSGIECTPLHEKDEKLRLMDIHPNNKTSHTDISNPIAYGLAFIIMTFIFYFGFTSLYKRLLQKIYFNLKDPQPTLERLHMYEGGFGFVLLLLFTIFVVPSSFNSRQASGVFICFWLIYSVTVGISRKSIITDVMGTTFEIDEIIRTTIRSIPFNMFWFYPLFIFYLIFYIVKMYSK